jgi:PmbA protein
MQRELYTTEIEQTALNVTANRIESVRRKNIRRSAVRMYDGSCIGIAGSLGAPDTDSLEQKARENLSLGIPYPFTPRENIREIRQSPPVFESEAEFLEEMEGLLAELTTRMPEFKFSDKLISTRFRSRLENDAGCELEWEGSEVSAVLTFKHERSTNIIDGMLPLESRRWNRGSFLDFAESYYRAYMTEEQKIEPGKYPVIFPYYDTVYQLKFMRDLHGLTYGSGGSLFSGKGGQQLFSDRFTLRQSRSGEEDFTGPFFDAEGTTNRDDRFPLIEKGVLRAPFTNRKYAARYDLPLTGAAACEYDGVPSLQPPFMSIEASQKTLRELVGDGPAVFLALTSGGDFTPDGHFATPAQLAFLYRDGVLQGRLPQLNVSSHVYSMFGEDYLGLSSDDLVPPGRTPSAVFSMEVSAI